MQGTCPDEALQGMETKEHSTDVRHRTKIMVINMRDLPFSKNIQGGYTNDRDADAGVVTESEITPNQLHPASHSCREGRNIEWGGGRGVMIYAHASAPCVKRKKQEAQ